MERTSIEAVLLCARLAGEHLGAADRIEREV
jgi:hypothetical protein